MTTFTTDPPGPPAGPPTSGPLVSCLMAVGDALDEVADVRCWSLSDGAVGDAVDVAFGLRNRLDELVLRLVAEAQTRDLPKQAGATSTAAWLRHRQRMSLREAGALARLASGLNGDYEQTRTAMAAGAVSTGQAQVICGAVDTLAENVPDLTADERAAAERHLVGLAEVHGPDELRRLGRRVFEVLSPRDADKLEGDLLADEEKRARQACRFTMRRVGDGTTRGSFRLPDAQADMLRTALEAMTAPRQWSRPAASGDTPRGDSDPEAVDEPVPPYPTRMGRAFADLVEHLPTDALPQHGGVNATVVATIDQTKLAAALGAATLSTGTRISAGQARRWACSAGILPAVMDGASTVLDLGRTSRLFSVKQRIALGIAQGGCCWAGCERPPGWCEAHHGRCPWEVGGTTDLADGILLCAYHHHLAHGGEWTVRFGDDRVPEVVPPLRIDPQQRPRRHTRFRPRE